jgi:hypothetical protein
MRIKSLFNTSLRRIREMILLTGKDFHDDAWRKISREDAQARY